MNKTDELCIDIIYLYDENNLEPINKLLEARKSTKPETDYYVNAISNISKKEITSNNLSFLLSKNILSSGENIIAIMFNLVETIDDVNEKIDFYNKLCHCLLSFDSKTFVYYIISKYPNVLIKSDFLLLTRIVENNSIILFKKAIKEYVEYTKSTFDSKYRNHFIIKTNKLYNENNCFLSILNDPRYFNQE